MHGCTPKPWLRKSTSKGYQGVQAAACGAAGPEAAGTAAVLVVHMQGRASEATAAVGQPDYREQ